MNKSPIAQNFTTFIEGALIGIGNIIPGVSGGTIAVVLGIYSRVLGALSKINWQTFVCCLRLLTLKKEARQEFVTEFKRCDFGFLIILGIGALVAIVGFSYVLPGFLEHHPVPTYSFFFALVLCSVIFPYKLLTQKTWKELTAALIAIVLMLAFSHTLSKHQQKTAEMQKQTISKGLSQNDVSVDNKRTLSRRLFYVLAGAIAISAMILPGISGSLLLLLLGVYFEIVYAIKARDMEVILFVALGCVSGLLCFSRFLNYILSNYYNTMMAFLTGLIIGSLYGIWPYREFYYRNHEIWYTVMATPDFTSKQFVISIITFAVGCALVIWFYRYDRKKSAAEK